MLLRRFVRFRSLQPTQNPTSDLGVNIIELCKIIKILKEGDLAVISPSVMHSVNSVAGEYEHVCAQVPSAFQYGFNFKEIVEHLPEDYDETRLGEQAKQELEEYKRCN